MAGIPGARVVTDSTADAVPMEAACTSRTACGQPLRGGIQILSPAAGCSAGFTATSTDSTRWLLTAGHCGVVNSTWRHGEQSLGPIRQTANGSWFDAAVNRDVRIDFARIRLDNSYWTQSAGGLLYNTASSTYPVKAALATEALPVGATVCSSSYSPYHSESAPKCGTVRYGYNSGGYTEISGMTVCHGDSGGAAYYENSTGKHPVGLISVFYYSGSGDPDCVPSGYNVGLSSMSSIYHYLDATTGSVKVRVDTR